MPLHPIQAYIDDETGDIKYNSETYRPVFRPSICVLCMQKIEKTENLVVEWSEIGEFTCCHLRCYNLLIHTKPMLKKKEKQENER